MKVIVTCGPSYEPIDDVRRLTNFSTGALGVLLSERLSSAGFEVICCKGTGATVPGPGGLCQIESFATNADLLELFRRFARKDSIRAIFQAAALCDFKVKQIQDGAGRLIDSPKISSRVDSLTLTLEPAPKVLAELRRLFPTSLIVGWKYEPGGDRLSALEKTFAQIRQNHTDAAVVNGAAFGPGFGFCRLPNQLEELRDKAGLVEFLTDWLQKQSPPVKEPRRT